MRLSQYRWSVATLATFVTAVAAAPRSAEAQQTGRIQGIVSDSASGRPVVAAQISIAGTTRGALTDDAGRFTVSVPAGSASISVQRIGFSPMTRTVTVNANETVRADFVLRAVAVSLSEVVTIGYGSTSRQNVSSAIATIDSTAVARVPVASLDNAFQGKVAGVQVTQNSGEPGGAVAVRVRGPSSLNAGNQPLYVVDGVPVIQGSFEQLPPSGQRLSAVSGINPDEIEQIDILKDAAATAIYGSRGSNGVILITTKRGGIGGRMRFNVSTYAGTQRVEKKLALLNSSEYVEVMNEARTNQNLARRFTPCPAPATPGCAGADSANFDWQDAIFRTAPMSDISLSMNGGTERARMYLSGSNFEQSGVVIVSRYQRQTVRLNVDANATDRMLVSASLGFGREKNNRVPGDQSTSGIVTNAVAEQPFSPIQGSHFGYSGTRESLLYPNPVATALFNKYNVNTLRGYGNLEARYSVFDRLNVTARVGGDIYGVDDVRWLSPKVDRGAGASVGGIGSSGHTTVSRYLMEGFANLDAIANAKQRLSITAGSSVEYNGTELNYVSGQGFPTGFDTYVRTAASIENYDGSATSNNLLSYFTRATWSALDRYQLSASFRGDGSSRFGKSNRYGFFPAASAGWTITEESFASGLAKHATLKLRGSYGMTGNQGIGDFASRTLASSAPYNGAAGLAPTQFGNPNLQWEQTTEGDLGIDLTLFSGRISLIADTYMRNTSNLLVQQPVPATSGYTTVWSNIGSLRNSGFDMGLQTINWQSRNNRFKWTTDLNVTWNKNEVTDLYRTAQDTTTPRVTFTTSSRITSVAAVGQPLGTFYLFKFLRVDPATGNAIYATYDGKESTAPSSTTDLMYVGNPQPKYYGGITNTFELAGFDVRAFLQFNRGAQVLNMMRIFMDDGGNSSDNKVAGVMARWRKPGDVTDMPRMGSTSGARLMSSRFVEDGSFVRFNELTLGYRLPQRFARKVSFDNARFFVAGRNLKTWTNYSGYNPDVNTNSSSNVVMGVDYYAYPLARTFTFGINAGW
jgi:TonB-linked SusC/RagA family outer membrane protein